MNLNRVIRLTAGAIAAAAVAGGVVLVTASATGASGPLLAASPGPSPKATAKTAAGTANCDSFKSHLASGLSKSQAEIDNAVKKAIGQTIDDAVKAGRLTQAQADKAKAKSATASVCSGVNAYLGKQEREEHGDNAGAVGATVIAQALGISPDELKADLKKGMSLHQIADSKGLTESQFRDRLVQGMTTKLDQAVKDGKLTKAHEDKILNRLKTAPLPSWDRVPKQHSKPSPTAKA